MINAMPSLTKHPKPANDLHMPSAQGVGYVVFPRPVLWGKKQKNIALALVGAIILLGIGFALGAYSAKTKSPVLATAPQAAPVVNAAPVAQQQEPFGITINASELAQDENKIAALAEQLPASVMPRGDGQARNLSPVMDIAVEHAEAAPADEYPEDQAEDDATAARKYARQGDVKQALHLQKRAIERDPANNEYRLGLAILYDRLGDEKAAAPLYRQVVKAYENYDDSLPRDLGIDDIRRRADYLEHAQLAMAQ